MGVGASPKHRYMVQVLETEPVRLVILSARVLKNSYRTDFRRVPLSVSAVAALPQPSVLFVLRPPLAPGSSAWWRRTQDKSWGQTGRRPCCTDRCSSGFTWFLQEESNLSKLVWVCFFVLFYSLVHILSPSVLNHLSAGLIQFTEFLSGIWCRSLYHPIPPRPGWCI